LSKAKSTTTKRKRVNEILDQLSTNCLLEALTVSLKKDGRMEEAAAVKRMSKKTFLSFSKVSPVEALGLLIDTNMTKKAYQAVRYVIL
jgi:hypothetical protein